MALSKAQMKSAAFRSRLPLGRVSLTASSRTTSIAVAGSRRPVRVNSSSTTTAVTDTRTATVQVDLGHAAEQAVVTLIHPNSRLVEATMLFPLGLVLENVDGEVVVTEVAKGSAAAAADCRVGDVVRATTAFTMQMTYPTMNLMFGGGGRPKLMKMLVPADKVPFTKVMDAVRSNTRDQGGDGSVTLVLERIDSSSSNGSSNGGSSSSSTDGSSSGGAEQEDGEAAGAQQGQSQEDALFDPRIFNSNFE